MAENSKIEWTNHTFNPWVGCTKISPACDHCYAEGWAKRSGSVQWGGERRRTTEANWRLPLKWDEQARRDGRRVRVFCASLADVFDNQVPFAWRVELFQLIAKTTNTDWLLLTKRIGNARQMLNEVIEELSHGINTWDEMPWPHVWIGATVCNQQEAGRDIPKLLSVPAAVRFLSIEPMLGPIDLERPRPGPDLDEGRICQPWLIQSGIDWVICGGESGPGARPMRPDWARSLRDQCAAAGVAFMFKQWGEWLPWHHFGDAAVDDPPEQTRFATVEWRDSAWVDVGHPDVWASKDGEIDDMQCMGKVGKKAAGRLLDGVLHDGIPGV